MRRTAFGIALTLLLVELACVPTKVELACPEGTRGCPCQNAGCKLSTLACVDNVCVDAMAMAGMGGAGGCTGAVGAGGEGSCDVPACVESHCGFLESWCSWAHAENFECYQSQYAGCEACVLDFRDRAADDPDTYCRALFQCWSGCVLSNGELGEPLVKVKQCVELECGGSAPGALCAG